MDFRFSRQRLQKWFICALMFPFAVFGYPKITSIAEIQDLLLESDAETLVIFDIDGVLITQEEPAFQLPNVQMHKSLTKQIVSELSKEEGYLLFCLMALRSNSCLLDEDILTVLPILNGRRIPTIALTSLASGSLAECPSIAEWRLEKLAEHGIRFSPLCDNLSLEEMPGVLGHCPVYQDGVLFATSRSKGEVLKAFLEKAELTPKRVIFLDDFEHNLQAVEEAFDGEFHGFHFTGAYLQPSIPIEAEAFEATWRSLSLEARHILESAS